MDNPKEVKKHNSKFKSNIKALYNKVRPYKDDDKGYDEGNPEDTVEKFGVK